MTQTTAIVVRYKPWTMAPQYLSRDTALFASAEWDWSDERSEAYVFDSHAEGAEEALKHWEADEVVHPMAVVLARDEAEGRLLTGVRLVEPWRRSVTPVDTFEALERRHLA